MTRARSWTTVGLVVLFLCIGFAAPVAASTIVADSPGGPEVAVHDPIFDHEVPVSEDRVAISGYDISGDGSGEIERRDSGHWISAESGELQIMDRYGDWNGVTVSEGTTSLWDDEIDTTSMESDFIIESTHTLGASLDAEIHNLEPNTEYLVQGPEDQHLTSDPGGNLDIDVGAQGEYAIIEDVDTVGYTVSVTGPDEAEPMERFEIEIDVENIGEQWDQQDIEIHFDEEHQTETVALEGGESTTLTVEHSYQHYGYQEIVVESDDTTQSHTMWIAGEDTISVSAENDFRVDVAREETGLEPEDIDTGYDRVFIGDELELIGSEGSEVLVSQIDPLEVHDLSGTVSVEHPDMDEVTFEGVTGGLEYSGSIEDGEELFDQLHSAGMQEIAVEFDTDADEARLDVDGDTVSSQDDIDGDVRLHSGEEGEHVLHFEHADEEISSEDEGYGLFGWLSWLGIGAIALGGWYVGSWMLGLGAAWAALGLLGMVFDDGTAQMIFLLMTVAGAFAGAAVIGNIITGDSQT